MNLGKLMYAQRHCYEEGKSTFNWQKRITENFKRVNDIRQAFKKWYILHHF